MKIVAAIGCVLGIAGLSIAICLWISKPKLAYVQNARLLLEYKGIKEGQQTYERKVERLNANLDTLKNEIQHLMMSYKTKFSTLSQKDKIMTEALIKQRQEEYYNYKASIDKQIQEEDQKLSKEVMNQIDSYVRDYGKEHGYNYVFGTCADGSLFYANEGDNITDAVLEGLNKKYSGEKTGK